MAGFGQKPRFSARSLQGCRELACGFAVAAEVAIAWLRALPAPPARDAQAAMLTSAMAERLLAGGAVEASVAAMVSLRGFHDRVRRTVGWGPKHVMRLARSQGALRQIHPQPWAKTAGEDVLPQYFDQAHFVNDCKALTRFTSAAFRASKQAQQDCLIHTLYRASGP